MKIFIHGLESSGRGAKGSFLRKLYPEMVAPDFAGSLAERMQALQAILARAKNITLVGSSFGGLMATIYAMKNQTSVERVILLAPALNFPELQNYQLQRTEIPTWMVIGRYDTVTPAQEVVPIARAIYANLHYEEADDDHMLAGTFRDLPWTAMLAGEEYTTAWNNPAHRP